MMGYQSTYQNHIFANVAWFNKTKKENGQVIHDTAGPDKGGQRVF